MSVEYRATLGYGLILPEIPDPDDIGAWDIIEAALEEYPLITFVTGGGGWGSNPTQYVLFIEGTMRGLGEVDGVVTLEKPKISSDALTQLYDAFVEITVDADYVASQWLIAGGFY